MICYVVWVGNFLARGEESGTGLNCVMTGHDAVESMRQDNVCTVLNAIKPIWPGDLPHLCSHLLASYAPVNHRETNVSSIFVCYDSSLTHGQLPAFEECVCGLYILFTWPEDTLIEERRCFIYKSFFFLFLSKRCWMVFFHVHLPMWKTKTDFHTVFLVTSEPPAPFYVRSGWIRRMAACPACPKTIKEGKRPRKALFS